MPLESPWLYFVDADWRIYIERSTLTVSFVVPLASALVVQLELPHINVLSKVDLVKRKHKK